MVYGLVNAIACLLLFLGVVNRETRIRLAEAEITSQVARERATRANETIVVLHSTPSLLSARRPRWRLKCGATITRLLVERDSYTHSSCSRDTDPMPTVDADADPN